MRETLGAAAAAMVLSALDVAGGEKALVADEEDGGSGLGIGEFFVQLSRLDGL